MPNLKRYEQISRDTAPPHLIVAHVLNRAGRYVGQMRHALEANDPGAAGDWYLKAYTALTALRDALRPEQGPEVAASFDRLYAWCQAQLERARQEADAAFLDGVCEVMATLETAWRQVGIPREPASDRPLELAAMQGEEF